MTFGTPMLHALYLLVPLSVAAFLYAHRRRQGGLDALLSVEALRSIVPAGARQARTWQGIAGVVAVAGLVFAATRPQFGFTWETRSAKGLNIVVILDVSRSMDAQDVSPSRMERARRELTDLAGLLRGDSVGLVLVANGAYVRLPLTTDYGTFLWALGDTSTQTIAAQGTAMAGGIDSATQMLTRAGAAGRAVLVVSDGELHDPPEALSAALVRAREADVHIYALGIGEADGAPIPLPEGGFKKDRAGDLVTSRLDADALRALAAATEGAYVEAVPGDDDVRAIYEGEIRGKLTAEEREVKRDQVPNEAYQWPLAIALFALIGSAWAGIAPRTGKHGVPGALLLLLALAAPGVAQAGAREEGLDALAKKDWPTAIDKLGQARVEEPTDSTIGQGLGEALYRAGRHREAEQLFLHLAQRDEDHRALHFYNAGNAAYRDGRLEKALEHYAAAQKEDPTLTSASTNSEAVSKEIALRERAAEQQEEGQQGEPQEGQEGQQGEPEEGQEGQQGEPQEGQEGQQGEPKDGEPKDGEPKDGEPKDGEPKDGEPKAGEPNDGEPKAGEPKAGEPGAADTAEGPVGADGEGDEPTEEGLSAEEAARLVDSVVDGRPRTRVGGDTTEKDW